MSVPKNAKKVVGHAVVGVRPRPRHPKGALIHRRGVGSKVAKGGRVDDPYGSVPPLDDDA
jgi:hypothetical protein